MFYENYVRLCNSVGKTPSAVAVELGIQKSTVTRWSDGSAPRDATVVKVADYFGVSVERLLGIEKDEKSSTPEGVELNLSDMELLDAFRNADDVTKELIRRALKLQ